MSTSSSQPKSTTFKVVVVLLAVLAALAITAVVTALVLSIPANGLA